MKILIAYGSKYGCSEKCAKILSQKINAATEVLDLKNYNNLNLNNYDLIILGGSIYAGKIRNEVTDFLKLNLDVLKNKRTAVFICCMREKEEAQKQLRDAFPKKILDNTISQGIFGWELIYTKMSFIDRFIAKKVSKIEKDTSNILADNINKFAEEINSYINSYNF